MWKWLVFCSVNIGYARDVFENSIGRAGRIIVAFRRLVEGACVQGRCKCDSATEAHQFAEYAKVAPIFLECFSLPILKIVQIQ